MAPWKWFRGFAFSFRGSFVRRWFKKFKHWLRELWHRWTLIAGLHKLPEKIEPSALAMLKVYRAFPDLPPDVLSAGIMRGGDALYVRHKGALEVFIGRSYDHAADELIAWLCNEGRQADFVDKSRLNRKDRRMYQAHFRKKRRR